MGNKGALALRLDFGNSPRETFTFVCGHLAAHTHNLEQRNRDWRNIVQRTIFSDGSSIYDTSHLFVCVAILSFYRFSEGGRFGDLNYRISTEGRKVQSSEDFWPGDMDQRLALFKSHDQLQQERLAGRTLHLLQEGELHFKPYALALYEPCLTVVSTYKYVPHHLAQFDNKRYVHARPLE